MCFGSFYWQWVIANVIFLCGNWCNISPFLTTFLSVHRPLQLVHVILFVISVTVFSNPTKLTGLLSLLSKYKQIFSLTDDAIRTEISFMKLNQTLIWHLAGLCFTPNVKTYKMYPWSLTVTRSQLIK